MEDTIGLVLLPLADASIAVEAKRVKRIDLDAGGATPHDLADLLGVPAPAGTRYLIELESGVTLRAGARIQRKLLEVRRFQRLPAILVGLERALGAVAVCCDEGRAWLVIRPDAQVFRHAADVGNRPDMDMRPSSQQIEPPC